MREAIRAGDKDGGPTACTKGLHEVEVDDHGDFAVLYPRGYLNGSAGRVVVDTCADLIATGLHHVVINFCHVETINTMGIANLVGLIEKASRREVEVCFCSLLPANRNILDALDISPGVLIFDSEEEAKVHVRPR